MHLTDGNSDGEAAQNRANPAAKNPFRNGIDRRRVLRSSAAIGATATLSGCLSDSTGSQAPTVYVFNNADRTMSVIDGAADELIETVFIDTTPLFPANQYGTDVEVSPSVIGSRRSALGTTVTADDAATRLIAAIAGRDGIRSHRRSPGCRFLPPKWGYYSAT
ncbi:twin-arginine translocation signal domain-containing protein [Natrinema sp. 1APR25-10V2]|uniref:twin-arginine translocation signal domain-containing protein n=1 Tax=Natrinema sp. 1APR25-10V2 TaxID=2951081 RepID=UPI002875E03C|nr:twin-arginine translocation signal domain-containing protein [Natrinema sp. 1APR25-10V2]MDS0475519.1 twin-arginine translocation signal domain-containing protein [Natrinema sp. 1APR25-10V2]